MMRIRWSALAAPVWVGLAWAGLAGAEPMELTMPNKLQARADFQQGARNRPAVLLLHGFLQTYDFPTIARLRVSLAGAGYTVLAPNLSLNIPARKQSLACEAIHTHTMESGSQEIDAWVKWLAGKTDAGVALAGHSTGSVQLLAYLAGKPNPAVKGLVAISIVEARNQFSDADKARYTRELRGKISRGETLPVQYPVSYCPKLNAVPTSLLSYLEWTPGRILREVNRNALPITFVMGSQDNRLGPDWVSRLKQTRARVHVIEGANHFMDDQHEFDLHDLFVEELKAM